jgi:hypothetical protein
MAMALIARAQATVTSKEWGVAGNEWRNKTAFQKCLGFGFARSSAFFEGDGIMLSFTMPIACPISSVHSTAYGSP